MLDKWMPDQHYQILDCTSKSSPEELKNAYKRKILHYHPDKQNAGDYDMFLRIQEAWKILGDPELKRKYDAECKQAELDSENNLIYDRIRISDMKLETNNTLSYPCRCGDSYLITSHDIEDFEDVLQIPCQECTFSLIIEK